MFPVDSKTLPLHANMRTTVASGCANGVPGKKSAVPSVSPTGRGPAGLDVNSSSRADVDMRKRVLAVSDGCEEDGDVLAE